MERKTWAVVCFLLPLTCVMPAVGHASYTYQGLEITPSASVEQGYDDNVTFVKNNPVRDGVTQISAGLGLKQEQEIQDFYLDTKVEEELFDKHSSFDNTSEYLNLLADKEFSELDRVKVTDVFSHAVEPTSFANAFGSTAGRYFTYYNTVNLNYHHEFSGQLAANFRYTNEIFDFTSKILSNSAMDIVGTGVEYSLDPRTILSADYDYKYRNFYPGSSAVENEFTEGLRHYLNQKLYAELRAGVDVISSFDNTDRTKPVYKASLVNQLDPRTQTGISFEKEYTTTGYIQDLFDTWKISGNYVKNFTSKLTGIFTVFYGSGVYKLNDIKEKYTGASIAASYEMNKNISFTLSYTFSQDDSTLQTDTYTKDTVFLASTYKF